MKKLINEIPESSGSVYQLWAELTDCAVPPGYKVLKFSSTWTGAKNPDIPHQKGQFLMSPDSLNNLKDLLNAK